MANLPLPKPEKSEFWNRRQFLKLGIVGTGVTLAGISTQHILPLLSSSLKAQAAINAIELDPMNTLRDFDYGMLKEENGRKIREFQIKAINSKLQLNQAVSLISWNYNGRVPGPTLRATAGERVRIIFENEGGHAHTMHFHGIHPAEADGVRPVRHGKTTVYEFDARPFGVHLYHCHITPVTRHISKGLYGMFIIDPPEGRPPADEIVLVMGGYDTNNDGKNELYAFNGLPNYYKTHPILIQQNKLVRLYILNMIEFDSAATFHIHGNFFQVYPTGMTVKPWQKTDVVTMGTSERHILEFYYSFPGKYMFHPHQDAIAESGCIGLFEVLPQT